MSDATIGALRVVLGADSAAFEKQMGQIAAKLKGIGDSLKVAGAGFTAGLTAPLVVLGKKSLKAYQDSENATAAVDAAIKSTGGTAGYTTAQLQDMAAQLQSISTFDDDDIMSKVTANMLTFGNISGGVFADAQKAALDLSARLGQDLQSSTIQVGKALNNPIKGISALSRVGVTFTADQKKMIEQMVKVGDMAGAQRIILDELFKEFGGQAEAAAQTTDGAWKQMENSIGDAMEAVGEAIAPFIKTFAELAKSIAEGFNSLDPTTKKFIVGIGAAAAAIGPVLFAIGLLMPALALLAPAFALVSAPVAIVVAAIGLVSIALNEMGIDFSQQWEAVKIAFKAVIDFIGNQIQFFKALFTGDFAGAFEAAKKIITDMLASLGNIIDTLFPGLVESMQKQATNLANTFIELKNKAVQAMADIYEGAKTWLQDKLSEVIDWAIGKFGALGDAIWSLYDRAVGHSYIPDLVTESGAWLNKMGNNFAKVGGEIQTRWNSDMAGMASANGAMVESPALSSVHNDNSSGFGSRGAGGGFRDIVFNVNATDAASFKLARGQIQADLADTVRAALAGR
ncbi:MAG: phage tail tape measure protein [Hyphomicrobiales bacterium]